MENRYAYAHSSNTKKNKVIWTPNLHKKFLEAVEMIGVNEAVPKKILELMKVEGLTRDHVASHLQKYRIYLKKIADANNQVQISSKPSLLESSMINGDSWKNSPSMLNQPTPQHNNFQSYRVMNPPVLDTSSFSFPVLEAACFNTGTSCKPAHDTWSLPNQGYPMQPSTTVPQTIPGGLERERNLITGDPELGVMSSVCVNSSNSSNSSVKHNLDGLMCDYGGSTIDLYPNVSTQMGSSGDFYPMNHENPSPNGFESNCFSHDGCVEMGSFYGCNSNEDPTYSSNKMEMNTDPSNLEDVIGDDDLTLDVAYISSLWETFFPEESCGNCYGESGSSSNDIPVTYKPPYEDTNNQNLPNMVSFDSINNEDHANNQQHSNGQPMEFVEDDVDLQTLIWDSLVQD